MGDMDLVSTCARSAALLEAIAKTRSERERVVEAARVERQRSYRLRKECQAWRDQSLQHVWRLWGESVASVPDRVPLEWTEPVSLEIALQDALRSAQECAAVCLDVASSLPRGFRGPLATVFSVSSLAAERLEEECNDRTATLGLCVRIIDANLAGLDEAGQSTEGAAAAARLCADRCRRALAALYLCREESV